MCATPQKVHCIEDGLQEMNVRVNTDTRCRIYIFSSNFDRCYGGDPNLRNNLDKAEKSKFLMDALRTWMMTNEKDFFYISRATFYIFVSGSKAISSEEEHSLNAIIRRKESGHYFIEARNKH